MPSRRILVVEDNAANLELMSYLLHAYGYTVDTAATGGEGLAEARRLQPDLIVCDIQLPDMDGFAVARAAAADPGLQAIPLVAVTALAMVGDRDRVLQAGFDGYIAKPIDPEQFVPSVENFLLGKNTPGVLPARAKDPGGAAAAPARAPRATILVLDDRPVNLALKRSLFEPVGYAVKTADTMAEALALARADPPDLILSDLGMAGASGFDFIKEIKADARLRDVPFLFITSTHRTEEARLHGLALGAARFLFRPMEPEDLLAEVEACLRRNPRG